jgi:hypothetical protein
MKKTRLLQCMRCLGLLGIFLVCVYSVKYAIGAEPRKYSRPKSSPPIDLIQNSRIKRLGNTEAAKGIIVFLRVPAGKNALGERLKIYSQNNLRLRTHLPLLNADIVDQKKNLTSTAWFHSNSRLLSFCELITRRPEIESCFLNSAIQPDNSVNSSQCTSGSCDLSCQIQNMQPLVGADDIACRHRLRRDPPINESGVSLSRYWSQEYSGVEPAKTELNRILASEGRSCDVPIGVLDTAFDTSRLRTRCPRSLPTQTGSNVSSGENCQFIDNSPASSRHQRSFADHGTNVASLVNDRQVGASQNASFTHLVRSSSLEDYVRASEEFSRMDHRDRPRIYNTSAGWNPGAVRALSPILQSAVMVTSAGNSAPDPVQPHKCSSGAIVVGSIHPLGVPSVNSQTSCVTVSVGSDEFLTAHNGISESRFGQTSGAAPLVAGSLANVELECTP